MTPSLLDLWQFALSALQHKHTRTVFLNSVVYLLYNSHITYSTSPSELLPSNWNTDGTVYSIKYQNQENQTVILKVSSQDAKIVLFSREIVQ